MELALLLDCAADVRASSRLKYSIPRPEVVYKDIRCQETIRERSSNYMTYRTTVTTYLRDRCGYATRWGIGGCGHGVKRVV
jgi:hypothetical protein